MNIDTKQFILFSIKLVSIAMRVHPFPFRTRKLSSFAPKILGGQLPGKIGRCQHLAHLAQSVEHAAVNRRVVGSSPTVGAKKKALRKLRGAFFNGIRLAANEIALQ